MEKNVYYYLLDVRLKNDNIEQVMSKEQKYSLFENIYNDAKQVGNHKTCQLEGQYYYDFLVFNEEEAFIKIGRVNSNTSIEVRDKRTLEAGPIEIQENEQLNTVVYFYIDFNTCISCILSSEGVGYGTPIKKLLMADFPSTIVIFANILSNDIINTIMKKDIIGMIEYEYAIPSDQMLNPDHMDYDIDIFDQLQNQQSMTFHQKFRIKKNKSAFKDNQGLLQVYTSLLDRHPHLKKFTVRAKNEGEKMEKFNIMEYKCKDTISYEEHDFSDYDSMFQIMKSAYEKKKGELCNFVR